MLLEHEHLKSQENMFIDWLVFVCKKMSAYDDGKSGRQVDDGKEGRQKILTRCFRFFNVSRGDEVRASFIYLDRLAPSESDPRKETLERDRMGRHVHAIEGYVEGEYVTGG